MKERISLVELSFREREEEIKKINARFPEELNRAKTEDAYRQSRIRFSSGLKVPGTRADAAINHNKAINDSFSAAVDELNERFRQANVKLNYHNGFIQISEDVLTERQIENPFWTITGADLWKNVDTDMKEAVNLRDTNGRDPAFYAARALESTIKIILEHKGWASPKETGAGQYIENLFKNGFIVDWERDFLKSYFKQIRNPLGHGPGAKDMPTLSDPQTDWAIETAMSWIKSLINR